MNNSIQFNFVDLYKDDDGKLVYMDTVPVFSYKMIVDTVSPQKSTIKCPYIPNVNEGDIGVMKNISNRPFKFFKVVNKDFDSTDGMSLTVLFDIDMLELTNICNGVVNDLEFKGNTFTLASLPYIFNLDIDRLAYKFSLKLPYFYVGWTPATAVYFPQSGIKTHAEILREKTRTHDIVTEFFIEEEGTTEDFKTSDKYRIKVNICQEIDNNVYNLDLRDKNVFLDYDINYSGMEYNCLELGFIQSEGNYYKTKKNGDILAWDGKGSPPTGWNTDTIKPYRIKTMIVKAPDTAQGGASPYETATNELKEQFYNNEISVTAVLENEKINFSELNKLFTKDMTLWIDGNPIETRVTRYEYEGGNTIKLKFGNARTLLTEKLRKKGVF